MRQVTTTETVYKFSELSDEAKEKALEYFRSQVFTDSYDYECVLEHAKEVAKLLGIDVENIYFSGFASQGDGASFTGYYRYSKGALQAIKKEYTQATELHRIAAELQDIQRRNFYGLRASISTSGRYCHEYSMRISADYYGNNDNFRISDETEEDLLEALRDFARWIYKQLETEYEWLCSEKGITENIDANEYEFTEDGAIY